MAIAAKNRSAVNALRSSPRAKVSPPGRGRVPENSRPAAGRTWAGRDTVDFATCPAPRNAAHVWATERRGEYCIATRTVRRRQIWVTYGPAVRSTLTAEVPL